MFSLVIGPIRSEGVDRVIVTHSINDRFLPAILLASNIITASSAISFIVTKDNAAYLSCSRLSGYLDPGGKRGFSSLALDPACGTGVFDGLEELPAFPD